MEFKGTFNVFGGASDKLADRLNQLLDYEGELISAHIPCPDITSFVRSRLSTGTEKFKMLDPESFKSKQWNWFDQVFQNKRLVFGDSHSLSAYREGYMINRNDGLTMYGALRRGLNTYIDGSIDDLVIYLGNIDLRFHLFRKSDPVDSADELIENYTIQLKAMRHLKNITVVGLLPVEHEERKIPGSGMYKGKPFYGSRDDRATLCHYMNDYLRAACEQWGWKFESWPKEWYDMDPIKFAGLHMERPGSVHLARHSYMHEW